MNTPQDIYKAQKNYSEKMKAEGKKQKMFWATDEEAEMLKETLEKIREATSRGFSINDVYTSVRINTSKDIQNNVYSMGITAKNLVHDNLKKVNGELANEVLSCSEDAVKTVEKILNEKFDQVNKIKEIIQFPWETELKKKG